MARTKSEHTETELKVLETLGLRFMGFNELQDELDCSSRTLRNYIGSNPEKKYSDRNLFLRRLVGKQSGKYFVTDKGKKYYKNYSTSEKIGGSLVLIIIYFSDVANYEMGVNYKIDNNDLLPEECDELEAEIKEKVLEPFAVLMKQYNIHEAKAKFFARVHPQHEHSENV